MPRDTLRYFSVANKHYRYFNYTDDSIPTKRLLQSKNSLTGWVELIEEGPINISKGFAERISYNGGGMMPVAGGGMAPMGGGTSVTYTPIYCLKKGNEPTVLIAASSYSIFRGDNISSYEVDDRNKKHFVHYISAYSELSKKVENKKLLFGEIEQIVSEYNNWAKSNNK